MGYGLEANENHLMFVVPFGTVVAVNRWKKEKNVMNIWMKKYAPCSLYKIKWPVLIESIVKNAGMIAKLLLNTSMRGGIDKQKRDGMDAKERAQDFETGTPYKQLGEIKYPWSQDVASVKDTCKLLRELSGNKNAKVRRLVSLAEGDDTTFDFAHQLKKGR
jgi:hypothetical protein